MEADDLGAVGLIEVAAHGVLDHLLELEPPRAPVMRSLAQWSRIGVDGPILD